MARRSMGSGFLPMLFGGGVVAVLAASSIFQLDKGVTLLLAGILLVLAQVSGRNRVVDVQEIEDVRALDPNLPFVLMLRPFSSDANLGVKNPERGSSVLAPSHHFEPANISFARLVAQAVKPERQLRVVGGDSVGPGTLRTADSEWREEVLRLARLADLVLVVALPGVEVRWECEQLRDHLLLSRTVFVMPSQNQILRLPEECVASMEDFILGLRRRGFALPDPEEETLFVRLNGSGSLLGKLSLPRDASYAEVRHALAAVRMVFVADEGPPRDRCELPRGYVEDPDLVQRTELGDLFVVVASARRCEEDGVGDTTRASVCCWVDASTLTRAEVQAARIAKESGWEIYRFEAWAIVSPGAYAIDGPLPETDAVPLDTVVHHAFLGGEVAVVLRRPTADGYDDAWRLLSEKVEREGYASLSVEQRRWFEAQSFLDAVENEGLTDYCRSRSPARAAECRAALEAVGMPELSELIQVVHAAMGNTVDLEREGEVGNTSSADADVDELAAAETLARDLAPLVENRIHEYVIRCGFCDRSAESPVSLQDVLDDQGLLSGFHRSKLQGADEIRLVGYEAAWEELAGKVAAGDYTSLSKEERVWFNVQSIANSIETGGIASFYREASDPMIADCESSLLAVGARELRRIVADLSSMFPAGALSTREARIAAMDAWADDGRVERLVVPIEAAAAELGEELTRLLCVYVANEKLCATTDS